MECPILTLLPIRPPTDAGNGVDTRSLQINYERVVDWTRLMCSYTASLEDRIAALEP
jgi:hypothetical protein|tara:strand:- start:19381 stop:19551 length:171 start_codon:yes stop_codon:yes gene_type:complete